MFLVLSYSTVPGRSVRYRVWRVWTIWKNVETRSPKNLSETVYVKYTVCHLDRCVTFLYYYTSVEYNMVCRFAQDYQSSDWQIGASRYASLWLSHYNNVSYPRDGNKGFNCSQFLNPSLLKCIRPIDWTMFHLWNTDNDNVFFEYLVQFGAGWVMNP